MTPTFRIALIAGDGIGKEVLPEGLRVVQAAAERFGFELECRTWTGPAATTTRRTAR
jgi:tartrate dehydrogenase/decarboxylase/D-malate dehydrogenase